MARCSGFGFRESGMFHVMLNLAWRLHAYIYIYIYICSEGMIVRECMNL